MSCFVSFNEKKPNTENEHGNGQISKDLKTLL